jgi:hypothetical protein
MSTRNKKERRRQKLYTSINKSLKQLGWLEPSLQGFSIGGLHAYAGILAERLVQKHLFTNHLEIAEKKDVNN